MTLEGYSKGGTVKEVLVTAGLEHLQVGFKDIDIESFRNLMIQDYEKYGVFDVEDKQALFKVVKDVDTYVGLSVLNSAGMGTRANSLGKENAWTTPTDATIDDSIELHTENANALDAFRRTDVGEFVELSVDSSFLLDCRHLEPDGSVTAVGGIASENQYDENNSHKENAKHVRAAADPKSKDPIRGLSENRSQSDLFQSNDLPRIRVIVRKRPLNSKEVEKGEADVIQCEPECSSLSVHEPKTKVDMTRFIETHQFRFDDVFDEHMDNESLYIEVVRPLVATVFKSGRGTCFAYGQTGSGKTYTMQPLPLRAASDIFSISAAIPSFKDLKMYVSCYEIYGGKIFDLFNSRKRLEAREDAKRRVRVVGLKEIEVSALHDLVQLCNHAASSRSTGSTGANDESSRSHSIMTFAIRVPKEEEENVCGLSVKDRSNTRNRGDHNKIPMKTLGKLTFIDLAGSERGADTYENDKQTRLEGAEINKSLLALKECIRALDMNAGHVPFRGSKLTSVLRDSFMGKNARTVMIANISPCSSSCEHTLNTLRYADRVKEMKKESPEKSDRKSDGFTPDKVVHVLMNLQAPDIEINDNVEIGISAQGGIAAQKVERRSTTSTQRDSSCFIETIESQYVARHRDTGENPTESPFSSSQQPISNSEWPGKPARQQFEELPLIHQQQIEDTMHLLKQEMDLLADLDPNVPQSISMRNYLDDLQSILARRSASLSLLQRKVDEYKLKHSSDAMPKSS